MITATQEGMGGIDIEYANSGPVGTGVEPLSQHSVLLPIGVSHQSYGHLTQLRSCGREMDGG